MVPDKMPNAMISVVIPTKNEQEDIAMTLERFLALDYDPKEVIVVDDSTDRTPAIVSSFANRGVRLLHRDRNANGCCGARSAGMKIARGEIVVLANADARPRSDFLRRVMEHYRNGADFLVVRSVLANPNDLWATYFAARERRVVESERTSGAGRMLWSEGFSVRRSAAESVGYIPGDFRVPFCRDWMFPAALAVAGFSRHVDLSINMEHVWPGTLASYWGNQVHRGAHSSPYAYYFRGLAAPVVLARETLKAGRTLVMYALVLPPLVRALRLVKYTSRGASDLPRLWLSMAVNDAATVVGNYKGWLRVVRAEGFWSRHRQVGAASAGTVS